MKRYLILFWRGFAGILALVAEWIAVILGMRDESKYGKLIRRVVGTCFATLMLLLTAAALWNFGQNICNPDWGGNDDMLSYNNRFLSRELSYHEGCDHDNYVFDREGKTVIKDIHWIAKPLGSDSLVCYSIGKKRGYFNMFTGKVVVKPEYAHAWVFSDGLASVDDDGWIKFIDQTGRIVFDPKIPYRPEKDGYVFHNGHCAVHNDRGDRLGFIDKQGKWALQPDYLSVEAIDSFWIVGNGKEHSVLNKKLQTVLPFIDAQLWINNGMIEAVMADHTIRTYSLSGEIIEDFHVSEVSQLFYDTNEIYYTTGRHYDDDGALLCETVDGEALARQSIAHCRRYQTEYGWYGLMTPDGHIVTPPSYADITAIGPNLYLCKTNYEHGVILNGKGQRVK